MRFFRGEALSFAELLYFMVSHKQYKVTDFSDPEQTGHDGQF